MCLKYPDTRYLIGRSRLTTLKQTTLKTFFEVANKLSLENDVDFKYNQQANIIVFENKSEVLLKDLQQQPSDPNFDSLGSLEITGAFIDEASQITEKAKNIVMSRIRYKLDENGLIPKIFMSTNPAKNWIFNSYYKPKLDGTIEPYREFIQSLVTDNKFISKHYINNLQKLDELSKKRLLYGEWEYSDDLAVINYDNLIEMFTPKISNLPGKYISIDVARLGKDKTTIIVWEGFKIIDFYEIDKGRANEQKDIIEQLKNKHNVHNQSMCFDADGVGGFLADLFPNSVEIINNSRPKSGENYQNLKTQLYYKLAEKINNGEIDASILNDEQRLRLTQELQVLKREKVESDGKVCITNKEMIKKQIGRSPDISDAMAYRMIFELEHYDGNYIIDFL